ncbi:MAG: mechanosensitive ion channel family protein [Acidimicrobiales bacterium]
MTSPALVGVEWSQGIEDAWSDVASFVPKLVGFLAILLIGYIVAKLIARVADRVLERVGFDRVVERGGIKQMLARSQYDASDIVSKLIYYALLLMVLQVAFAVFGENPVSDMIDGIIAYVPKVLAAIIIVVVAAAIAGIVKDMVTTAVGGLSYGKMLGNLVAVAIVTVGAFAALSQLEIAPAIVNGLFYAILAVVVGSAIVAVGGGGIQPMRQRWENALNRYDEEKPRLRREVQEARDRGDVVQGRGEVDMTRSEQRTTPPISAP